MNWTKNVEINNGRYLSKGTVHKPNKHKEKEIINMQMQGTVKFFDKTKGWGFISSDKDSKEYFVHQTGIQMDGFRHLDENDIVDFEVMTAKNGKEQAVKVVPVLTMQMIKDALKEEDLYVSTFKDVYGVTMYRVFDADNVIQTSEQGLPFFDK